MDNKTKGQQYFRLREILGQKKVKVFCDPVLGLDIIGLDDELNNKIERYDSTACTYNGKENVSMRQVVEGEFGKEAAELIMQLL